MKIHRITCLVIDPNNPNTPAQEYADMLENCKHVNPSILSVESAEIGEWHDDHPLNHAATRDAAIVAAFTPPVPTDVATRVARAAEIRRQISALKKELYTLPPMYEEWRYDWADCWSRDNLEDEPTLEAAKEAADNALKAQGALLK